MPPVIDTTLCTACRTCVTVCPLQVFRFKENADQVPRVAFPYECWHCNACVLDCKQGAIRLRIPLSSQMMHVEAASLQRGEPCAR